MTRKTKDECIGILVESSMKKEILNIARQRDCPLSQVVREAVRQYLEGLKAA